MPSSSTRRVAPTTATELRLPGEAKSTQACSRTSYNGLGCRTCGAGTRSVTDPHSSMTPARARSRWALRAACSSTSRRIGADRDCHDCVRTVSVHFRGRDCQLRMKPPSATVAPHGRNGPWTIRGTRLPDIAKRSTRRRRGTSSSSWLGPAGHVRPTDARSVSGSDGLIAARIRVAE